MSFFDRAERLMSRHVGKASNEEVLITPMRTGKMVISADPTRSPFTILATLNVRSSAKRPLGEGNTAGDVGVIMAPDITLSIELRFLGGKPEIRNGDRITATKRPGQPSFIVAQEAPIGITERVWSLLPDNEDE